MEKQKQSDLFSLFSSHLEKYTKGNLKNTNDI